MYQVYKAYSNTFDRQFDTYEDLMAFVTRKAEKMNYGLYRHWEQNGDLYFDCGPTVYRVRVVKFSA